MYTLVDDETAVQYESPGLVTKTDDDGGDIDDGDDEDDYGNDNKVIKKNRHSCGYPARRLV